MVLESKIPVRTVKHNLPARRKLTSRPTVITLNIAHELRDKPDELITRYLETEERYYNHAKENWAQLPPDAHERKIEAIFGNNDARIAQVLGADRDPTVFMTKNEFTQHRERIAYPDLETTAPFYVLPRRPMLTDLYSDLLNEPTDDMSSSEKVSDDVRRLSGKGDMKSWNKLSGEDKWVLQLYGDECFERYGGLEMWVGELVPQEILKAVRGGDWDDSDDDDSSYNSEYD